MSPPRLKFSLVLWYLEETLNHFNSIELKNYLGGNVTYCCAATSVYDERFDSSVYFKPEHLDYTTLIFEDTYDLRFSIW